MAVLAAAVAEYLTVSAPWHLTEDVPNAKTGLATTGFTVTVCMAITGPLQPEAVAVTTKEPDQFAAKVTSPVDALIVFPPEVPAAFNVYTMAVAFAADAA